MPDERQVPLERPPIALEPAPGRETPALRRSGRKVGRRLFGLGVLAILLGSLAIGIWQHYQQYPQVTANNPVLVHFLSNGRIDLFRLIVGIDVLHLTGSSHVFPTVD